MASKVLTTPSDQSEKAMPSNGNGWIGVGSVSNGSIEANAKIQAPLGEDQFVDLLPGHSAQKPPRLVPAFTKRRLPLPPWGREKTPSAPGPKDSRKMTPGAGAVVGRGLPGPATGGGLAAPPPPPAPPLPPWAAKACVDETAKVAKIATICFKFIKGSPVWGGTSKDPDDRQYETGIIRRIAKSDFAMYYSSSSFRLATAFTTVYERTISPRVDFLFRAARSIVSSPQRSPRKSGKAPSRRAEHETAEIRSPWLPDRRTRSGIGAARPERRIWHRLLQCR